MADHATISKAEDENSHIVGWVNHDFEASIENITERFWNLWPHDDVDYWAESLKLDYYADATKHLLDKYAGKTRKWCNTRFSATRGRKAKKILIERNLYRAGRAKARDIKNYWEGPGVR